MKTQTLKSRTLLTLLGAFVILVLLNFVSVRIFGRIDMTGNRLFSLSDASKELMRSLDDRVTVKAYFTEDLPAPYSNHRRTLLDQLNEFRAYSKGNFQFEFIDPTGEKGEQDAQRQGIAQAQVQVVNNDKFEVKRAYMGMALFYEDRKEVIPIIENIGSLEYDLASAVKKLTTRTRKKIGFLTGQGEPGLNEFATVQKELTRQYDVIPVDLSRNTPAPADLAALIIAAPTTRFPDHIKFQIDQFIMRGGRVAFLLNKVEADLQQRFGRPVELGIEDLLEHYGLRLNADLVRDAQCANITIVQQQFGFSMQSQVPFPYLPLVSDFSKDNMMVKDLKGVVLFFASSVDTTQLAGKGIRGEVLLRTSKQTGRQEQYFILDPLTRFTQADFALVGLPLGIVLSGRFASAYSGKPVPVDTAAGSTPAQGSPLTGSPDTRIVLIGDGDFARDSYLGNRDNLTLFANLVDYLVDDAGLITIRSKDATLPPLDQVSEGTKKLLKYGNLVLPPLAALAVGLVRWRMRKTRKKALEMQ